MSELPKQAYVGVSGVVSPDIQAQIEAIAEEVGLTYEGRLIALGVKSVHKTQYLDIPNKYGPEWYPVGADAFRNALRHDRPNIATIAVAQAYLDVDYVDSWQYREEFLKRILDRGQPWLQAIQFDSMPWHANNEMWEFLEQVKQRDIQVFLQAHKGVMKTLGPKSTVKMLKHYGDIVDYVLFDSSHGTGTRLNVDELEPFVAEAYDKLDLTKTGVAIAGGLNGQIIRQELPYFVDKYPDLSWDAEGQLHPVGFDGKRPLDMGVTRAYLQASAEVIGAAL